MVQDSMWGTGDTPQKAEQKLRHSLEVCFTSKDGNTPIRDWHTAMRYHMLSAGVGDFQGMGFRSFAYWMEGDGKDRNIDVRASTMRGMQHFIKHWDGKL
jgi:hypothetical protein